jgi:hypothetical protein
MRWFRKSRQREDEPPYYLINVDGARPSRFSFANLAKGIGALLTVLTIMATVSVLYERTKRTSLDLNIDQTASGYFLRIVNSGNATAISVQVNVESWPAGAPGS